jgi:hypothetical protein
MALQARSNDTHGSATRQGQTAAPTVRPAFDGGDNSVVPEIRDLLRQAIDDCKWKHEAVAAHIDRDGHYFSKMLAGEKAITARDLRNLPDDIEACFAKLYAEQFGLVVVAPVQGEEAVHQLVTGLVGVLGLLPRRAAGMAKAAIR